MVRDRRKYAFNPPKIRFSYTFLRGSFAPAPITGTSVDGIPSRYDPACLAAHVCLACSVRSPHVLSFLSAEKY
jgi:hypothetical protein